VSSEPRQPSEEELRAAYEAEIKRLRVEHVLLDNVAALANLGMRRTGLAPGTESEREPAQVRLAIESIRALLPVLEQAAPSQIGAIRDAVSQLQIAYVRIGGKEPAGGAGGEGGGSGSSTPPRAEPAGSSPPETAAPSDTQPGAPSDTEPGAPSDTEPGAPPRPEPGAPPPSEPSKTGEPGPAQRSGRLWVPRQ
jgi:hypothetical protein